MKVESSLLDSLPVFLSKSVSQNSSIRLIKSNINQVFYFEKVLSDLNIVEMASFLGGFVVAQLGLGTLHQQSKLILDKFLQTLDLLRDQIITKKSFIEVIVDTISYVKKRQSKIHAEDIDQQKVRMLLTRFSETLSEVALDCDYLNKKWDHQRRTAEQERKNEEIIQKYLEEEKRNKMRMEQENEIMLMKLLEEQKNQRLNKQKEDERRNMQCQICIVDIEYKDLGTLECGHMFHRECIHGFIKNAIMENKLDMKCPMEECECIISISDIQEYLEGELLDKFNQFSLNRYVEMNNADTSWCPTPGCPALFERDEALDNYRCPSCKKHYCLACKCEYHKGMSCAEYRINNNYSKEDREFEKFVKGAKFKQCPKCKFWVQRNQGCSTMACRCGIEFCYDCGGTGCPHGRCTGSGKKKK